jgi:hypothetical protein
MSDPKLLMEPMEIGNLMYAELDNKKYVGADSEWCELTGRTPAGFDYAVVTDEYLVRRLRAKWVETKFQGFDHYIAKHIAKRGSK